MSSRSTKKLEIAFVDAIREYDRHTPGLSPLDVMRALQNVQEQMGEIVRIKISKGYYPHLYTQWPSVK